MNYELVFDAGQSGYRNWPFGAGGLIFVCIGAFLVKHRRNLPTMFPGGMRSKAASAFAYVFLIFSVLWTTVAFTATARDYSAVSNALQNGNAQLVEGRVENFTPMPYVGHAQEYFSVCSVPFSYSDYIMTAGFNHTSSHGGPIRPGLWVRISYVGNTIARLEIATQDPGPQAECHGGSDLTRR
jgi:hypothetical protein